MSDPHNLGMGARVRALLKWLLPASVRLALRRGLGRVRQAWRVLWDIKPELVPLGFEPSVRVEGTIAAYFGDTATRMYQIDQWVPVLERLHEQHSVVIVTRYAAAYEQLVKETSLPVVCAPRFEHLMELYRLSDFPVTLYVNNSRANFQSLAHRSTMHVHVSHGESDKLSMASNQIKAYDRAFVAGEAAVRRFQSTVLGLDVTRLVRIGRPQLDIEVRPVLDPSQRRTVLYAPTWEGEDEGNNYTSVDVYGVRIVEALLALPDVRVVYRPHPRVAASADKSILAAHEHIVRLLAEAEHHDHAAGHVYDIESDIVALFDGVDLLVSDVSSVALDFLYRRTDSPIVLTDRLSDPAALLRTSPLAACVNVIDSSTIDDVGSLLGKELAEDLRLADRTWARNLYFDGLGVGESTDRFFAALDELLATRTQLIEDRQLHAADYLRHVTGRKDARAADRRTRRRAG